MPASLELAGSYRLCRDLHRAHGRTYYLATRLLPAWKRPHVHALYGFTRCTDDLLDRPGDGTDRVTALREWTAAFRAACAGGPARHPVLPALVHTIGVFGLDRTDLEAFLHSMELDLTVTQYRTYEDLLDYMAGSAAAIGSLMLPILGAPDPGSAREPARELGRAFQLTNFIRDVPEDAGLGRTYLPLEDLDAAGVTVGELRAGLATPRIRRLIAFEVDRARHHYRAAAAGIPMLEPGSQACVRAAFRAYGGILDEVARAGYDVFSRRAVVPRRRKLRIAASCLLTPPGRPERALPGRPRACPAMTP
jgi:phytoene synthase